MHIGYCTESQNYVLSQGHSRDEAESFKSDAKINNVIKTLQGLGHTVEFIDGVGGLMKRLVEHQANPPDGKKKPTSPWDLVWNDCEGLSGRARESQAPALLEAFGVPYTHSDASTMAMCLDKGVAKMFLEHNSIPTAPFLIFPNPINESNTGNIPQMDIRSTLRNAIANSRYSAQLQKYPLFVKPVSEHTSKGISSISKCHNEEELHHATITVSRQFPGRDILIESFLSGREFTVAIAGSGENARVIGVSAMLFKPGEADFLHCEQKFGQLDAVKESIPMTTDLLYDPEAEEACEVALTTWRLVKGRDIGRIDVRFDKEGGRPNVIEINPIPGMVEGFSLLLIAAEGYGYNYPDLFKMVIESAMMRYQRQYRAPARTGVHLC